MTPSGRLRLDAVARILQDIGSDDTADARIDDEGAWVLRRLAWRVDRLPSLRADLQLRTWCSGTGPRWAERRTDLLVDGSVWIAATAIWACTAWETGAPIPLTDTFHATYGVSAAGRRVSARLEHPEPPATASRVPWPMRVTDFDVLGHVNNASYWASIEERLEPRSSLKPGSRIAFASIEFRGGVDPGDAVSVAEVESAAELRQWWLVDGDVRASTLVEFQA